MPRPGIVYCHLNDDNSGSPRVLGHSMQALAQRFARPLLLLSSSQSGGFLGRSGIEVRRYPFHKALRHPWLGLSFLFGQVVLALQIARARPERGAPIFVNTLMPIGGAIYGAITGRPVIFHSHEIPGSRLEKLLFRIMVRCSSAVLCVSQAHRDMLPLGAIASRGVEVLPNPVDPGLAAAARSASKSHRASGHFEVLFVTASLLPHKGVAEFLALARALQNRADIRLVLATSSEAGGTELADLPPNVTCHFNQQKLEALYGRADLVLNLSRPDLWIETFGLTIVEAMAFGTPVIVPPLGGPAELVQAGVQGYLIDCRHTAAVASAVVELADRPQLWAELSRSARERAASFTFDRYQHRLRELVDRFMAGPHGAGRVRSLR